MNNLTIKLFIELIQVAIGNRSALSSVPTLQEWQRLYNLMSMHTLIGIGYVAIQRLPRKQWPPKMLVLKWTSVANGIRNRNISLNEECRSICETFTLDGVESVVIKGQSNLEYYPEALRDYRMPGDIDLWCQARNGVEIGEMIKGEVVNSEFQGIDGVIEYCKQYERIRGRDIHWNRVLYYHCELRSDSGIAIEPHYRISYLHSPIRNHRLQKWFTLQFDVCLRNKGQLGFPVLTSSVNVVYQLVHLYRHVFEGGIGLRQMMDYYFTLRTWHEESTPVMSAKEVMAVLRSFGMRKFAGAVMYVLHEAFENEECLSELEMRNEKLGIERELKEMGPQADGEWSAITRNGQQLSKKYYAPWMICEPNEKEGRKLLAEIMQGGNFGQYDTRDIALKKGGMMKHGVWKLKRVMRLVRSYPEEALWEPVFRVYHLLWRWING